MKEDIGSRRKRGAKPKGRPEMAHEMSEKAGGYSEGSMPMAAKSKGSRRRKGKSGRGC